MPSSVQAPRLPGSMVPDQIAKVGQSAAAWQSDILEQEPMTFSLRGRTTASDLLYQSF